MADIKTQLRELSVAITIGLSKNNIKFKVEDLYDRHKFEKYAKETIDNWNSCNSNFSKVDFSSTELCQIIKNGYDLGKIIYCDNQFCISKDDKIVWVGNDTQKGDTIDLIVGTYRFSLKENSFILKNMGLYQLLNNLTNCHYERGLHVFYQFSSEEYDNWFAYTWEQLIKYLEKKSYWKSNKGGTIKKSNDFIVLAYCDKEFRVPINITKCFEYNQCTSSTVREKTFSKWINEYMNDNEKYIELKRKCAEKAGKSLCELIAKNFSQNHIYDFFQISNIEYYYAKTTENEKIVLKVPAKSNFNSVIVYEGSAYDIPRSQLNIISKFKNKETGKVLEFRNECRFSHGQFNGTPEAKMYVDKNTSLAEIYIPVIKK